MKKKQIGLTKRPMITAAQIGTKPAPGVMATRPITRPVEAPTPVGLPEVIFSIKSQESMAAAAAVKGHFVDVRQLMNEGVSA